MKTFLKILIVLEAMLFIGQCPSYSQTTLPTTIATTQAAQTRPAYSPPPKRTVVNLTPSVDITAQLLSIKPGTANVEFVVNTDVKVTGTIALPPMTNCALVGGGHMVTTLDAQGHLKDAQFIGGHKLTISLSNGSGTGIDLRNTDLEISGFRIVPDQASVGFAKATATAIRLGKGKFHDCTLEAMCSDFLVAEGPFADGCEVFNLKSNTKVGSRFIFGIGVWDFYAHDILDLYDSLGEDLNRFTLNNALRKPARLHLQRLTLANRSTLDKADVSVRECDNPLLEDLWLQDGWLRVGQDNSAESVKNPVIRNCLFSPVTICQGQYPLTSLQFIGAENLFVSKCTYQNNTLPDKTIVTGKDAKGNPITAVIHFNTGQAISVSQVSTVKSIDSCIQQSMDGTKPKALVMNSSANVIVPTNCKVVMPQ